MRNDITEISVDDAVSMMAYVYAEFKKRYGRTPSDNVIKDSFAMALRYEHSFNIDDLLIQTQERAAVLEGI